MTKELPRKNSVDFEVTTLAVPSVDMDAYHLVRLLDPRHASERPRR